MIEISHIYMTRTVKNADFIVIDQKTIIKTDTVCQICFVYYNSSESINNGKHGIWKQSYNIQYIETII